MEIKREHLTENSFFKMLVEETGKYVLDILSNKPLQQSNPCVVEVNKPEIDLLSTAEILDLTHPPIGRTTLYNWTKAGKVKAFKVGKRVYYSKANILEFLTSIQKRPPKF